MCNLGGHQVVIDHHGDQFAKAAGWLPPDLSPGLARIAQQQVHFRGPEEFFLDRDIVVIVQHAEPGERERGQRGGGQVGPTSFSRRLVSRSPLKRIS